MEKYTFSGHESFQCKSIWLKKGYDFIEGKNSFNDDSSIVKLGVGKNMVSSIRYWLKAFGIVDEEMEPTLLARYIFDSREGRDPFLEDIFTVWILHYNLVKTNYATLYNEFFLNFQRGVIEFNKREVFEFIRRQFSLDLFGNTKFNSNTIKKDIDVLIKNYVTPKKSRKSDDAFTLLSRLHLINLMDTDNYILTPPYAESYLPYLFSMALIDNAEQTRVLDFNEAKKLGLIFCLSESRTVKLLEMISQMNLGISYQNTAGEQLITIHTDCDIYIFLDQYYNA